MVSLDEGSPFCASCNDYLPFHQEEAHVVLQKLEKEAIFLDCLLLLLFHCAHYENYVENHLKVDEGEEGVGIPLEFLVIE